MNRSPLFALLALHCGLLPGVAAAQTIVDQGSFDISIGGQRVAREDFTIRRRAAGAGFVLQASATVSYGDRRVTPRTETDSSGSVSLFEVEVKGGTGPESWQVQVARGGRVRSDAVSAKGDQHREYIVTEGTAVIDDDVFHQYSFLAKRRPGTISVMLPRRHQQVAMKLAAVGADKIAIGGRELECQHLRLTEPDGAVRDFWVDATGRLLKVSIPGRNLVALREDPPR